MVGELPANFQLRRPNVFSTEHSPLCTSVPSAVANSAAIYSLDFTLLDSVVLSHWLLRWNYSCMYLCMYAFISLPLCVNVCLCVCVCLEVCGTVPASSARYSDSVYERSVYWCHAEMHIVHLLLLVWGVIYDKSCTVARKPHHAVGTCEASWFDSISNRTSDSRFDSYWWFDSKFSKFSNRRRCQPSFV